MKTLTDKSFRFVWSVSSALSSGRTPLPIRHPISELQISPLVIAAKVWTKIILGIGCPLSGQRRSEISIGRAHASTDLSNALIEQYVVFECTYSFHRSFARVASLSDPSDKPSKLNFGPPWLRTEQQTSLFLPAHCQSGD